MRLHWKGFYETEYYGYIGLIGTATIGTIELLLLCFALYTFFVLPKKLGKVSQDLDKAISQSQSRNGSKKSSHKSRSKHLRRGHPNRNNSPKISIISGSGGGDETMNRLSLQANNVSVSTSNPGGIVMPSMTNVKSLSVNHSYNYNSNINLSPKGDHYSNANTPSDANCRISNVYTLSPVTFGSTLNLNENNMTSINLSNSTNNGNNGNNSNNNNNNNNNNNDSNGNNVCLSMGSFDIAQMDQSAITESGKDNSRGQDDVTRNIAQQQAGDRPLSSMNVNIANNDMNVSSKANGNVYGGSMDNLLTPVSTYNHPPTSKNVIPPKMQLSRFDSDNNHNDTDKDNDNDNDNDNENSTEVSVDNDFLNKGDTVRTIESSIVSIEKQTNNNINTNIGNTETQNKIVINDTDETDLEMKLKLKWEIARKKKKRDKIEKIKQTVMISKVLFISSVLWSWIYQYWAFATIFNVTVLNERNWNCGDRAIVILLYSLQRSSLMFFFVLRLYYSFINTIYQMNIKLIIVCLCISFCVYVIGGIWYTIEAYSSKFGELGFECNTDRLTPPILFTVISDVVWNIFLGTLFMYKLKQVSNNAFVKRIQHEAKKFNDKTRRATLTLASNIGNIGNITSLSTKTKQTSGSRIQMASQQGKFKHSIQIVQPHPTIDVKHNKQETNKNKNDNKNKNKNQHNRKNKDEKPKQGQTNLQLSDTSFDIDIENNININITMSRPKALLQTASISRNDDNYDENINSNYNHPNLIIEVSQHDHEDDGDTDGDMTDGGKDVDSSYHDHNREMNDVSASATSRSIGSRFGSMRSSRLNRKGNDKYGSTRKRGLSVDEVNKMQQLVNKLLTLLLVNVTISLTVLFFLAQNLSYVGAGLDMLVSNVCLWFAYNFNDVHYRKFCKLCILCCIACNCNGVA